MGGHRARHAKIANGKCVQYKQIFRFHAKRHERKQENLAFRFQADGVWDALDLAAKLRAAGYKEVQFKATEMVPLW